MANYADTKEYASFGRIIGSLKRQSGFSAMPKGGPKWADCDISKMEAWIAAGFPE